ncbi:zinc ribbon domain-containing protein [Mycolicibacterium sphagni]|uniref:zinc ribbon domain-containing protein n=1 Tax=Mycolicibacterium sphagni TaxID=1786 RepID=UPI0015753514|nr:zinc ribbon domain-containing protein [Mycolicibacterium sphagni]
MILYDFDCENGHRFEDGLPSMDSAAPDCVVCGSVTRRRISKVHIGGMAKAGPSRAQMPNTWRAVGQGDRETVAHWHELVRRREALEERHPELAGDRRPVLAHEGIFADNPLRAGDDILASVASALATSGRGRYNSHATTKPTAKESDPA